MKGFTIVYCHYQRNKLVIPIHFRKRSSGYSQNNTRNTSLCDVCSFIKIFAVILAISLLALLGVLTIIMYQQIGELQMALASGKYENQRHFLCYTYSLRSLFLKIVRNVY